VNPHHVSIVQFWPVEPSLVPGEGFCEGSRAGWEEKLSIRFGGQGGVTHQLGGEPKMRFYSTALVMVAIVMMLANLQIINGGPVLRLIEGGLSN